MMTFRLGTWKTGVAPTGALRESSLLAPAIESRPAKTLEIPKPARPPKKTEGFYYDASRTRRLNLWLSSIPLSVTVAVGYYLYFTGAPEWIAGTVTLGGVVVFGLAGLLIEYLRVKPFVCPCCRAPIQDWDTNESHRILFNCARCESSWDIEYKERKHRAVRRRRYRRTDLATLCSLRGAN